MVSNFSDLAKEGDAQSMEDWEKLARDYEARRALAQETKPEWTGDLNDDCTAYWAGFILRAEEMDRRRWGKRSAILRRLKDLSCFGVRSCIERFLRVYRAPSWVHPG